jgi:mycothiol system anti-sigma-R factor
MADEQPGEHQHVGAKPDCAAALDELYTYLDGELTAETRALISSHLSDCNPCLEVFDFEAELRIVVQSKCRDEVPESLRLKIEQTIIEFRAAAPDS